MYLDVHLLYFGDFPAMLIPLNSDRPVHFRTGAWLDSIDPT